MPSFSKRQTLAAINEKKQRINKINYMKKIKFYCKTIFICISLFFGKYCNAQSVFQKDYTGINFNIGYSIQTDNSGFVIAGATSSSGQGGKDVLLMKTDLNGNILWAKTIGGNGDDVAHCLKKTSDGGYIIVGSTSSYVYAPIDSSNFYIIKTDNSGNVQWTRSIGSFNTEVANDVIETSDHKFAIVGYTRSIGPGNADVYFMELDSIGNLQWAYGMGGVGNDFGNSLTQTNTNKFIIVGSTTGFSAVGQIPYLINTSELGVVQNSYTFNLNTSYNIQKRYFTKIIEGYFNDYMITGSVGIGTIGDAQHFILDIGQNTVINWMKKYTLNSGEGVGTSLEKTLDNGFIIGGTMGLDHPALIKIDAIGQLITTKFFPNTSSSYHGKGLDVKSTNDGGFALVGFRYNASDTSVYLIKTDNNLSSGCDESNGFINTATNMSPIANVQTTTYATGSNYIAIDSGIVLTAFPYMNVICFTTGIDQNSIIEKTLKIQQSAFSVNFLLTDNNDMIVKIDIYNVIGEKMKSNGVNNQYISTIEFSKGIYFYQLLTKNNVTYSGKINIQ